LSLGNITPDNITTAVVSATNVNVAGDIAASAATFHKIIAAATDGLLIESSNGTDVGILGPTNTANATWYGQHNFSTDIAVSGRTTTGTLGASGIVSANAGLWTTTLNASGLLTGSTASFSGMVSANAGLRATTVSASGVIGGSNLSGTNTGDQTITLSGDASGSGTAGITVAVTRIQGTQISAGTIGVGEVLTYVADNKWSPRSVAGTGDVVGPASAADNALVRYDGTTGKLIQNSGAILDDTGNLDLVGWLDADYLYAGGASINGTVSANTLYVASTINGNIDTGYSGLTTKDISTTQKLFFVWEETASANGQINFKVHSPGVRTIDLFSSLTVLASSNISGTNTGDQTITLSGDVSGSGTGAITTVVTRIQGTQISAGTPSVGQVLTYVADNKWSPRTASGSGDVVGPAGATDNALARFDSTTGKLIKNSGVIVTDSNEMYVNTIYVSAGLLSLADNSQLTTSDSCVISFGPNNVISTGDNCGWKFGDDSDISTETSAGSTLRISSYSSAGLAVTPFITMTAAAGNATCDIDTTTLTVTGITSAQGGINTTTVSATTGSFSGMVSANAGLSTTTLNASGLLTGNTASFSGIVSANAGLVGTTASFSGIVSANSGIVSTTGSFSGSLTGSTASFSGIVSAGAGINTTTVSAANIGLTGNMTANQITVSAAQVNGRATITGKLSADGGLATTTVSASGTIHGSNLSGTNTGDQTITLTGAVSGSGTGSFVTTLVSVSDSVTVRGYRPYVTVTTAQFTLQPSDAGFTILCSSGTSMVVVIGASATNTIRVGSEIELVQMGAGGVSVSAVAGETLNSYTGLRTLQGQYAGATLKKVADNNWVLIGNLKA
jgi:hypothetical protein